MQNRKNLKVQPKITFDKELSDNKFAFMKALINKTNESSIVSSNDTEMIIRKAEKIAGNEELRTVDLKIVQEYEKVGR